MTNHVHLLATPENEQGISRMMPSLGRRYVRYFNQTHQRTGTLWEGRFRSCIVDTEDYLLVCQRYIELNPVRAGMVDQPVDYRWSSCGANGPGRPAGLWRPHPCYRALGNTPEECAMACRELFVEQLDPAVLAEIRQASRQGTALGSDRFKRQIEDLSGRRARARKRGPKVRAGVGE